MPDDHVTEAVLDGRRDYRQLSMPDSRWVVAELTHRGYSVREIAGWLKCSTRQVKRVRAELLTEVMGLLAEERERAAQAERRFANVRRDNSRLVERCAELETRNDIHVMATLSQLGTGKRSSAPH